MSSPSEAISNPHHSSRAGKNIVLEDLNQFGPRSSAPPMDVRQAQKYCKTLAERHYENFSIASFLVPASIRQDFYNIYAYSRWSDDLADEIGNTAESLRLLDWWRMELRACFSGIAKHPVFIALKETIREHPLTLEHFERLLDAFVQDQSVLRYSSRQELIKYCSGSANPVGRILLQLAQVTAPHAWQLSDQVCTGLQIANFCQDIRQDALRGRIYLPREIWERFQISESEILAGQVTENLRSALKEWGDSARMHLLSGLPLVRLTPRWLARDIQLFARGGLTILDNIKAANFDVWDRPIEVSKKQKLVLLVRAILFPRSIHVADRTRPRGSQLA